jgi:hypothetical protein
MLSDSFDRHLDTLVRAIKDWERKHPAERASLLPALDASWSAICAIATIPELPTNAVHRFMMWQTARLYQLHSLFLLLAQQLDGGMALLRMAAELTRDISHIGDSPERLDLWLARSEPARKKEYRREFRFDESDPIMAYVKRAYDLASTWGVHSHLTAASHLAVADTAQGVARLIVDDSAVNRSFMVWACAFVPIQLACIKTFLPAFGDTLQPFYQELAEVGETLCRSAPQAA